MRMLTFFLTVAAVLLLFLSCGESSKQEPQVDVTSVTLNQTSLILTEGETSTLTATVNPADATNKTVTWKSSSIAVAMVEGGKVTAVKEGTATITASCGGKTATCEVKVEKKVIPVSSVSLNKSSLSLVEGESSTLTASINPSDATDQTITWSSSNTAVATVNGGKVTAIKEGTSTITASCGGKSATCAVTVKKKVIPVTSVSLNKTTVKLKQNETVQLTATVNPTDATDKTLKWSSSNTVIATVTNNGLVKALREGTATITATAGDKSATCTVTVSNTGTGGNEGVGDENWN